MFRTDALLQVCVRPTVNKPAKLLQPPVVGAQPVVYVYAQIGGLGVTAGVHRLWSHRAYKARRPLRYLLAVFFSVAGQNTILNWVRDHRVHHKFTETDADPHNAKRGFFFAHCGWLLQRKHPDVYSQGAKVDLSDVESDPVVQWHTRNFRLLKFIFCLVVPTLIPVYCWGETWTIAVVTCVTRLVILINLTWLVNSAAHLYGTHPYDKRINPTENALVSALSNGEGWHNYHHIFPWDYKASEHKYLNFTTVFLDQFVRIGWAYDLKSASPDLVARVALRHGDGSHPKHGVEEHFQEVPYDEYLRILKDDDELTGVRDLHNAEDPTRQRVA
ncbi:acyl-CoA Delta-9 desaturase-like isoform X2 [Frankliniella occidentalis]|uniref:Acyl-CoA Delta-9 desaturase-like isoform X2 n=1 Tax=Frankliniella occidentalis TaxID=133901 RepID=A0A9C6X9W1_FRAOC|nr:acyl-CoA Delta-9 desaturase-like isoform X2 [Frankliniella occidentalis]